MSEWPDEMKNARVVFGLRAQGHIPTVEAMLREGFSWADIGQEIGWDGETAKRFYELDADHRAEHGEDGCDPRLCYVERALGAAASSSGDTETAT